MKTLKTSVQLAAIAAVLFLFWCYSHSESYCIFYPNIDTHYASGYSETAFGKVVTGMTYQAVQDLLGSPLHGHTNKDASVRWCYTDDGNALCGDWAWFGREVVFRGDRVAEALRITYHD